MQQLFFDNQALEYLSPILESLLLAEPKQEHQPVNLYWYYYITNRILLQFVIWQGDMGETWGMKIEKGVLFCDTFITFLFDSILYVIYADLSPLENQRCEHRM